MKTVEDMRAEMRTLMQERGIRTLSEVSGELERDACTSATSIDDRPFFSGYSYGTLYDWDQYFDSILQLYAEWDGTYIRNCLELFLDRTDNDGHIVRTLPRVWWGTDMVKPFLAQQALLLVRAKRDMDWFFPEYFYRMRLYLTHWLFHHDVRGAGLSVWDAAGHTGMDNQHERAGYFGDTYCEGVDLNSYLVRECRAYALLAEHFGRDRESAIFRGYADERAEAINRWCWNSDEGYYYDFHARRAEPIRVKYVGAFAALWAQIASPEQADRLVTEHLLNQKEFWRSWPVPALAATEPVYIEGLAPDDLGGCASWRAHTWIPTNYYTFHGLVNYGYHQAAGELAVKTRELFARNPFREYYATETGEGCGLSPFWGWSSLALYMEDELDVGRDPTAMRLGTLTYPDVALPPASAYPVRPGLTQKLNQVSEAGQRSVMSAGERMKAIYEFRDVDHLPRTEFYIWDEAIERWRHEGLPEDWAENNLFAYDPPAIFDTGLDLGWCEPPFIPEFEDKTIETHGDHEIIQDRAGRLLRVFKGRRHGFMPDYLKHAVSNMADWENVSQRLDPTNPERWAGLAEMLAKARSGANEVGGILNQRLIGGYMYLRALIGPEDLLYMFYDQPDVIHAAMQGWLSLMDAALERVQAQIDIDEIYMAEDICYNHGLLVSPGTMREFLLPYYQRLLQNARARQKQKLYYHVDTDGDCRPAIPIYYELGMTKMSPFEVASGCDVVEIGKQYPGLVMAGGIDKRVLAAGKDAIESHLQHIIPFMVRRGGYYPTCDHGVPDDVSLENYMYYRRRLCELDSRQ